MNLYGGNKRIQEFRCDTCPIATGTKSAVTVGNLATGQQKTRIEAAQTANELYPYCTVIESLSFALAMLAAPKQKRPVTGRPAELVKRIEHLATLLAHLPKSLPEHLDDSNYQFYLDHDKLYLQTDSVLRKEIKGKIGEGCLDLEDEADAKVDEGTEDPEMDDTDVPLSAIIQDALDLEMQAHISVQRFCVNIAHQSNGNLHATGAQEDVWELTSNDLVQ